MLAQPRLILVAGLLIAASTVVSAGYAGTSAQGEPDEHVAALLKLIRDENPNVASIGSKVKKVKEQNVTSKAVEALLKILAERMSTPSSQRMAAYALGLIGPDAKDAVTILKQTLGELRPEGVREQVAFSLTLIDPSNAKEAVPILASFLTHGEAYLRQSANMREQTFAALERVGEDAVGAVPHLIAALSAPEWADRGRAAKLLSKFGSKAEPARPQLMKLVGDNEHPLVQYWALITLKGLGPLPKEMMPALVSAFSAKDHRAELRAEVLESLKSYDKDTLIPALVRIIQDRKAADIARGGAVLLFSATIIADHAIRLSPTDSDRVGVPPLWNHI